MYTPGITFNKIVFLITIHKTKIFIYSTIVHIMTIPRLLQKEFKIVLYLNNNNTINKIYILHILHNT